MSARDGSSFSVFLHATEDETAGTLEPFQGILSPLGVEIRHLQEEGFDAFVAGAKDADAKRGYTLAPDAVRDRFLYDPYAIEMSVPGMSAEEGARMKEVMAKALSQS